MRNIDKAIQIFYEKYVSSTEKLPVDEVIKECGLVNPEKYQDEFIFNIIRAGDFIYIKEYLEPKANFLSGIPFRIQLHPLEIENSILISGHRFLPFCCSSMRVDELKLVYNNKKIKQKKMKFSIDEIHIFFNLMDPARIPVDNMEDYMNNKTCSFNVYDMKDVYKEHNVNPGDTLVVEPVDILKGEFSITVETSEKMKKNIKEVREVTRRFTENFSMVVRGSDIFMNSESQLLIAYYFFSDYGFSVAPDALARILSESGEIAYCLMREGFVRFCEKDDNIRSLADFSIEDNMSNPLDADPDSIDGILNMLGSSHTDIAVRALILQQLPLLEFKFDAIENYLFENSLTMDIYEEVRDLFQEKVKELYDDCLEEYGTKAPPLLVQSIRSRVLGLNQEIAQFLRTLDRNKIKLDLLPVDRISEIMEISGFADSVLYLLEDTSGYSDTEQLKTINKSLDDITNSLAGIIDNVFDEVDSDAEDICIPDDFSEVLQLKVALKGIKPPVWRRVEVPDNITFFHLHHIIQESMGWYDVHLHSFEVCLKGTTDVVQNIGEPSDEDFREVDDEQLIPVKPLFESDDVTVNYIYDFGDFWEHKITLEKIIPREKSADYPRCIKGKRACPPEDCGGTYGYEELLNILKDKNHPEYEEMIDWAGDDFDPEYFSIDDIDFSHMY